MNKGHVLVVDDNAANRSLLESILELENLNVMTAATGAQALTLAQEAKPALILLDVMMDDMNGFDVLRYLKDSESTSGIPVIMVTGLDALDSRQRALEAGACGVVSKPVDFEELLTIINTLAKGE